MIRGMVTSAYQAIIPLRCRAPGQPDLTLQAIVDTGFDGHLILPQPIVDGLGFLHVADSHATLADGTSRETEMYAVEIEWNGSWRSTLASNVADQVLIGTKLLRGQELRIRFVVDGAVEIETMT